MTKHDEKFLIDKEDFLINMIALTIANNYLSKATHQTVDYWTQKIGQEANQHCDNLTDAEKELIIQNYLMVKATAFQDDEVYE